MHRGVNPWEGEELLKLKDSVDTRADGVNWPGIDGGWQWEEGFRPSEEGSGTASP